MPWKDGSGLTTQLFISPKGASLATGFDWRLSMAKVGAGGPFSRFEGYDRHLLLLEGEGMRLHLPEGEHLMNRKLLPFSFPGEWAITAELLNGPCRDFNLIARRAAWRSELRYLEVTTTPTSLPAAPMRALHALTAMRVDHLALEAGDTLILDAEDDPTLQITGQPRSAALLALLHSSR